MQSSTNVLALTYGVFVVTTILPLSPIDIAAHLPDIFEIFSHLVERMEKEAVGMETLHTSTRLPWIVTVGS